MEGVEDGRRGDPHGMISMGSVHPRSSPAIGSEGSSCSSVREKEVDILITAVPRMKHSSMGYHINPCVIVVTGTDRHQNTLEQRAATVFTSHTQPHTGLLCHTHTYRVRLYTVVITCSCLLKGGYWEQSQLSCSAVKQTVCLLFRYVYINNYQIRWI